MKNRNKSNLFAHIGFGKAGSSKLQRDIFPVLCRYLSYKYYVGEYVNPQKKMYHNLFTNLETKLILGLPVEELELPNNFLISNEELSHYRNSEYFEEYADQCLKALGKDAHIILIIREPRNWLSSIYIQCCVHEKPLQDPKNYFLTNENYNERLPNSKFNVDKFNYINYINVLRDRFDFVTIVKFEALYELSFLKRIFPISDSQHLHLRQLYGFNKNFVNRAISITSYKFIKKFNTLLSFFGLSYAPKYSNETLLLRSNYKFIIGKHNGKLQKTSIVKLIAIRSLRYFASFFHYKFLFQKVIDKIIPYKKFMLNFEELPYIKIDQLEKMYKNLPDDITYKK